VNERGHEREQDPAAQILIAGILRSVHAPSMENAGCARILRRA
jgi:hypothetical protein